MRNFATSQQFSLRDANNKRRRKYSKLFSSAGNFPPVLSLWYFGEKWKTLYLCGWKYLLRFLIFESG
jgi:hypothetical protein